MKFMESGCQKNLKRARLFSNRIARWKESHPADGAFEEHDDLPGHLFLPLLLDYERVMKGHHEICGVQLRLVEREKFDQYGGSFDLSHATLVETRGRSSVQFVVRSKNTTMTGVHCHFLLNSVLEIIPRNISAARDSVSSLIKIEGSRSKFTYDCRVPAHAAKHVCFVIISRAEELMDLKALVRPSGNVEHSERFTILPVRGSLQ